MIERIFLVVAQAARSFLRSVDQFLQMSKCGLVASTAAAEVSHLGLGQLDVILMKWASGVNDGVEQCGAED